MSIWCNVEGSVDIPRESHFSIRKYTKEMFVDEYSLHTLGNLVLLNAVLEGETAAKTIQKWVDGIPGKVDVTAEIRFIK